MPGFFSECACASYSAAKRTSILRGILPHKRRSPWTETSRICQARKFPRALQHLPQHVLQNSAVLVVGNFFGCVHARDHRERFRFSITRLGPPRSHLFRRERRDACDLDTVTPQQPTPFAPST